MDQHPEIVVVPDNEPFVDLVQVRASGAFGTGLLVGRGLVLTALHGVPPAVLGFFTVRSQVRGWSWPGVDTLLRNVLFMACYHGVQCGMHAMFPAAATYCTP